MMEYINYAVQFGVPAAIAVFLVRSIQRTNELLVTKVMNGYAQKLDILSDRIASLDSSVKLLVEVIRDGGPVGKGTRKESPEGQKDGKVEGDSRLPGDTA